MDGQREGSALIVAAESARFGLPEVSLGLILEAVGYANDLDAGLAHETTLAALAAASGDAAEGIASFREKRTPSFGGPR